MKRYFSLFFMIITLSFAIPPAVEEITEGVEKSLIARHVKNTRFYSEQLASLTLDAETFLLDQDAEDKTRIPIYYGEPHGHPIAAARQFIDKPLNMLKLREFAEEPFDHIVVHKYGFGVFCDKAEEEKLVKGIAALVVAHKITKNPAIVVAFEDKSKDAGLGKDVVNHKKLARGIFAKLSGEDLGIEKDDLIDRSVDAIIADNNCIHYVENLRYLIDNSFPGGPSRVPFENSPYNNRYLASFLPPLDTIHKFRESFPWINKMMVVDIAKPKTPVSESLKIPTPSAAASRSIYRSDKRVHRSDLPEASEVHKPDPLDIPSEKVSDERIENADNSPDKDRMTSSKGEPVGKDADSPVEAQEASPESADADPGDKKSDDSPSDTELLEGFVNVDGLDANDEYLSDESYGLASTEATPRRTLPPNDALQRIYTGRSSSSGLSSIGNSPIVRVLPGEPDPYHID